MEEPQPNQEGDLPPINREALSALTGGDDEFERELLGAYYESVPAIFGDLQQAVALLDLKRIVYNAHTIKGSSRSIAAERTAGAAQALETAGRQNDVESLPAAFAVLDREMSTLMDVLSQILQEP